MSGVSSRVRLSDADSDGAWGRAWAGAELQLEDDFKEYTCKVPWWVGRVNIDTLDSRAEPDYVKLRRRNPTSIAGVGRPLEGAMPLTVGTNRAWIDFPTEESTSPTSGVDGCFRSVPMCVVRDELLFQLKSRLKPYELAQLSVTLYIVCFSAAWYFDLRSVFAVPLLATIPIGRICPDLWRARSDLQSGSSTDKRHPRNTVVIAAACIVATWAAYVILGTRWGATNREVRSHPGVPRYAPSAHQPETRARTPLQEEQEEEKLPVQRECGDLTGLDCSEHLSSWAGPRNCAMLAETEGTCAAYCQQWNRTCLRACDDAGTGDCTLATDGSARQLMEAHGCFQDWRTQVCVCSEPWRPPTTTTTSPLPRSEQPATLQSTPTRAVAPDDAVVAGRQTTVGGHKLAVSEFMVQPCFWANIMYTPLDMPGQGRTSEDSATQCQNRCFRTSGCARFTWWPDGGCHLQEYYTDRQHAMGPVAGPSSCSDEEELANLLGDGQPGRSAQEAVPRHGVLGSGTRLENYVFIVSALHSQCLHVSRAIAWLQPCQFGSTAAEQQWELTQQGLLRNQMSGQCLSATSVSDSNVQEHDCDFLEGEHQRWELTRRGFLRNMYTSSCIITHRTSFHVLLATCDPEGVSDGGAPAQRWELRSQWDYTAWQAHLRLPVEGNPIFLTILVVFLISLAGSGLLDPPQYM